MLKLSSNRAAAQLDVGPILSAARRAPGSRPSRRSPPPGMREGRDTLTVGDGSASGAHRCASRSVLVVLPLFVRNAVRAAGWMVMFGSKGL